VTRKELAKEVARALGDLDDTECYGDNEGRFFDVISLFESIDWGQIPKDVTAEVFREIVRIVPMRFLTGLGGRGERQALLTKARRVVASNNQSRKEAARERAAQRGAA